MPTVLKQVGEEWIVDKLDEVVQTTGDFIAWGTGAGTHTKTNPATLLFNEASEARVIATRSQPTQDKIRWVGTLTCTGTGKTITNAGNFTTPGFETGVLIVAGDFPGIPLAVGDKIEFTIDLEIT